MGITRHDKLAVNPRLRLHQRAEGFHDHLQKSFGCIAEERVDQADVNGVLGLFRFLAASDDTRDC